MKTAGVADVLRFSSRTLGAFAYDEPNRIYLATVRLLTAKTRGMLTRDTMLTMVFKIIVVCTKTLAPFECP